MLFPHELVDLIVEVADLEIAQALVLDLGHLARDLLEYLAAPFLADGDPLDGGDEFGPSRARDVEDAQVGGLRGAEAEQHRLRFLGVSRLGGIVSEKLVVYRRRAHTMVAMSSNWSWWSGCYVKPLWPTAAMENAELSCVQMLFCAAVLALHMLSALSAAFDYVSTTRILSCSISALMCGVLLPDSNLLADIQSAIVRSLQKVILQRRRGSTATRLDSVIVTSTARTFAHF